MMDWRVRSPEEAALLNPAFCAVLLACCAHDYAREANRPLPFVLAFLALPIVLHKPTRDRLPRRKDSSMTTWMEQDSSARIGFVERARSLVPLVREAILFGAQHGHLTLNGEGALSSNSRLSSSSLDATTEESRECFLKAHFVGRWFAATGSSATAMSVWGVVP